MNQKTKENIPNNTENPNLEISNGFSWGAFGLPVFWAFSMHLNGLSLLAGVITFFFIIPHLNLIAIIGYPLLVIFMGITGYKFAGRSKTWSSTEEFVNTQNVWNVMGIIGTMVGIWIITNWVTYSLNHYNPILTGDFPVFYGFHPGHYFYPPRAYHMEIKAGVSSIQLAIERYAERNPKGEFPKKVEILQSYGFNTRYTNPITNNPGKVVPYGSFSAGDYSYLLSIDPRNKGYLLVIYGTGTKKDHTNNDNIVPEVIKGYGGNGVIKVLHNI